MSHFEPSHHTHSNPSRDDATPNPHPGKKRERHSWLFWVGLVFALMALVFYTLTGNLAGWYGSRPAQPVATASAK